jgi:preprotein translocase subunit YajC
MAFGLDPILLAFLALIIVVILAFYFLIRRTAMAFREGSNRGRR